MSENFVVYKIHPGDTLDSIGEKLGISGDEVRDFHNQNCRKAGLLWINGLSGISRIVIPNKTAQEIKEEKRLFLPELRWTPNFLYPHYFVTETLKEGAEKTVEIAYETDLVFPSPEQNGWVAEVKNHSYKKEGTDVDDKMGGLALAVMDAVYPVPFKIAEHGRLSGIVDPEELLNKFRKKRSDIEEFYTGDTVAAYLNIFEENLKSGDHFFRGLASTLQFRVLFPDLGLFHQSGSFQRNFSVYPCSFPVNCVFDVSHDFSDDDFAVTSFNGTIEDKCSLPDLWRGSRTEADTEEKIDGNITLNYKTSKKDKKLEEASVDIMLRYDGEDYFEHRLTLKRS